MARVLIVDDDYDTVYSCARLLQKWGHETRWAYDGESVLQQALAFQPQVVLLDIGLPGMDGYEVARRLRQYQQLVGIKIVAVTGNATPEHAQKCRDAGFDDSFTKPVEPERLRNYLSSME